MQRFGRVLRLKQGAESEYDSYHREVWPEIVESCRQSGILNYTIFRHGRWLFSYFELPDGVALEDVGKSVADSEASAKWEKLMHDLQEPLPESQGENWWVLMDEVWHLENRDSE